MSPTTLQESNLTRLQFIASHLKTPAGELRELFLDAATTAVTASLETHGKILLPLELTAQAPADAQLVPVLLPVALVRKLDEFSQAADIEEGTAAIIEEIMQGTLESTLADVMIACFDITDPNAIAKLQELQTAELAAG